MTMGDRRGLWVLLLILAAVAGSATPAAAQPCERGTASMTGSEPCAPCAFGQFQSETGQTTCLACDAGSFSAITGSTLCLDCEPGSFTGSAGQTTCLSCGLGEFQANAGGTTCELCGLGTANASSGQATCPSCGPGTFTASLGQTTCTACDAGTFQSASGATVCADCDPGTFASELGSTVCAACVPGTFTASSASTVCAGCAPGTASAVTGATSCAPCAADTFADGIGQATCDPCSTCLDGSFESAGCSTDTDAVCAACDPTCLTCSGPGLNECTSCIPTRELAGGRCQSLCGGTPKPGCLLAEQAVLQSIEKKPGKERLVLQWKKITTATTRASFGDPVGGDTIAVLCVFNDAGALVGEHVVDRGGAPCGTKPKPCWKTTGKQGLAYADKAASAFGIAKLAFGGGAARKGKANAAGKNDAPKGLTSLPTGLVAALAGNTAPTIQLITDDGLCVAATMNKVGKDDGQQYKAQKK